MNVTIASGIATIPTGETSCVIKHPQVSPSAIVLYSVQKPTVGSIKPAVCKADGYFTVQLDEPFEDDDVEIGWLLVC